MLRFISMVLSMVFQAFFIAMVAMAAMMFFENDYPVFGYITSGFGLFVAFVCYLGYSIRDQSNEQSPTPPNHSGDNREP